MNNINDLPSLSYDVGLIGSCALDESVGPVCAGIGVAIGILINRGIHPE